MPCKLSVDLSGAQSEYSIFLIILNFLKWFLDFLVCPLFGALIFFFSKPPNR